MKIDQVFEKNQEWVKSKLDLDAEYFPNLAKGQSPEMLYIGCSDSRVTAEELMGAGPGEMFVHRNIANMVSNLDLSSMSAINFAVVHLKVKHIVVCGHYYCGGIKAALDSKDLGILNPWLRNIRDVYRTHSEELNAIEDEEKKNKRLVELNVEEQCFNVLKTAEVQLAYQKGDIQVHGWVFDIHSGHLIDLNIDYKAAFERIREIYQIA